MSSSFGELVLVLGDLHIPDRASKIHPAIQRMLVPNKMQHVICTGNLSPESLAELQQLAPNLHCVAGDYDCCDVDQQHQSFPETKVVQVGSFRIGVLHGHQMIPWKSREAVQRMRRKLQVDILITGHTHQSEVVVEDDGFCHINPVSGVATLQMILLWRWLTSFFSSASATSPGIHYGSLLHSQRRSCYTFFCSLGGSGDQGGVLCL